MQRQNHLLYICLAFSILLATFSPQWLLKAVFSEEIKSAIEAWGVWYRSFRFDLSHLPLGEKLYIYTFQALTIILPLFPLVGYAIFSKIEEKRLKEKRLSAEFGKIRDVRDRLGQDGFKLSKKLQLKEKFSYEHVLVIGPTGSGKSQSFFFPNLYYLPPKASIVVTDPKLELFRLSKDYNDSIGRKSVLIKIDDPTLSTFWNPLEIYQNPEDMNRLCELIVKNRPGSQGGGGGGDQEFWDQAAVNVLFTLIYVVKSLPHPRQCDELLKDPTEPFLDEEGKIRYPNYFANFFNIYEMASTMSFEAIIGLAMYAASLGDESIYVRAKTFSEDVAPEDTRNSMRSVLMPSLAAFLTDSVRLTTAYNEVDFRKLKREPTALFVSLAEHKTEGLEGLQAVLYRQIFDSTIEESGRQQMEGGPDYPVFFLLDEFANIGKLIGIAKALATIRSRKLAVAICLQSIEQLTRNYTESEKKDILNNLKTKVILPGLTEAESLEYFSRVAGKTAIYEKTSTKGEKQVIEKNRLEPVAIRELYSGYRFRLLTGLFQIFPPLERKYYKLPAAIKRLCEKHELIVFFADRPPIKDEQARAYLDPKILRWWKKIKKPQKNPKEKIVEAKRRFFSVSDVELLNKIGLFLYFCGDANRVQQSESQRAAAIDAFQFMISSFESIEYEIENGKLRLKLKRRKDFSRVQAKVIATILERGFAWAYKNGVFSPHDKRGSLPIMPRGQ